jgi:hypothetical protein
MATDKVGEYQVNSQKHYFIKRYSTSVLMVYAIAIFLLTIMAFIDNGIDPYKFITAIGTGGILIVAGDLLRSPFSLSMNLFRTYNDLATACDIHSSATDISNQIIHGVKAKSWLKHKKIEAVKKSAQCATNAQAETIIFYAGNILMTLGFSSFLLVFASEMFYGWVTSIQPLFTIVSFLFLVISMIIKEYGEYSIEEVSQEKGQVAMMTNSQLQQKHRTRKKYDKDENEGKPINE